MTWHSETELRADPREAGRARAWTRDVLTGWGLSGPTDTVILLVSELVTNAIVHTESPARLRLVLDGSLRVEVTDTGPNAPSPRHPAADDPGGRGLELVGLLAQHWGWHFHPGGKTVWCALTAGPDSRPATPVSGAS